MSLARESGQPVRDPARLAALRETDLLDTLPEESFDRFTRIARAVLRSDVSLLSLVDLDRQFFKSQAGLPAPYDRERQTPLSHSFCKLVVETGQPLMVEDARVDDRVRENLAIRDLGVVAYLGMPVRSEDGFVLGSMCAIQTTPRQWAAEDQALLLDLAALVSTEIWMRQRTAALGEAVMLLEESERDREREARMLVHDLRTPVSGVLSTLELLQYTLPSPTAEQTELLQIVRHSGERLDSMIEELLRFPSEPAAEREEVAVSALLRHTARLLRPLPREHGLDLTVDAPPSGKLSGVEVRALERVLLNLLTNAVKFSPPGVKSSSAPGQPCTKDAQGSSSKSGITGLALPRRNRR